VPRCPLEAATTAVNRNGTTALFPFGNTIAAAQMWGDDAANGRARSLATIQSKTKLEENP
jgi:hypothetical protein